MPAVAATSPAPRLRTSGVAVRMRQTTSGALRLSASDCEREVLPGNQRTETAIVKTISPTSQPSTAERCGVARKSLKKQTKENVIFFFISTRIFRMIQ